MMRTVVSLLRWIWVLVLLTAVGVGVVALNNWVCGRNEPLWVGPVLVLNMGVGMALLRWCERRGWIKGVLWSRPKELDDRKRALAAERERILAEFETKSKAG